jgi:hypothetical protein
MRGARLAEDGREEAARQRAVDVVPGELLVKQQEVEVEVEVEVEAAAAVLAAADAKEEACLSKVWWEEAAWQWAADQDPDLLLSLSSWSSTTVLYLFGRVWR